MKVESSKCEWKIQNYPTYEIETDFCVTQSVYVIYIINEMKNDVHYYFIHVY